MTHSYVWHDSSIHVLDSFICMIWLIYTYDTWLVHMCDVTHSFLASTVSTALWRQQPCEDLWHDSFICVTWLIHVWCDSFIPSSYGVNSSVTSNKAFDMTHSFVWHDWFICVTWLIHTCYMTHSYMWNDTLICVTWRIHMCDMTHSYVWHDSFVCVTWLIHVCDMTDTH